MVMCQHSQDFETCRFGCTLRKKEELRLRLDELEAENKKLKEITESVADYRHSVLYRKWRKYIENTPTELQVDFIAYQQQEAINVIAAQRPEG